VSYRTPPTGSPIVTEAGDAKPWRGMTFIEVRGLNEHLFKTTSVSFFDILESNSGNG
jgi:hypothetical protein